MFTYCRLSFSATHKLDHFSSPSFMLSLRRFFNTACTPWKALAVPMLSAILASAALAGPVTNPNLVTNGSFEQTTLASGKWGNYKSLPGWSSGSLGIELRNSVAGKAEDGNNFVELDTTGNSFMTQDLLGSTDLRGWVTLSFWYSARPGTTAATNGLQYGFGDDVYSLLNLSNSASSNQWNLWTGSFNLTATDLLRFQSLGKSDGVGMSIDNVSVVRENPLTVPEPGSLALAVVAMLGAVVTQRLKAQRRRQERFLP